MAMTKPKSDQVQEQLSEMGAVSAALVRDAAIEAERFQVKPGKAEEYERFLSHNHGDNRVIYQTAELWARTIQYEKKQNPKKPFHDIAKDALAECMPRSRNRNPTMMMAMMVGHLNKYWVHGEELKTLLRTKPTFLIGDHHGPDGAGKYL
jgi:hypothetical protein